MSDSLYSLGLELDAAQSAESIARFKAELAVSASSQTIQSLPSPFPLTSERPMTDDTETAALPSPLPSLLPIPAAPPSADYTISGAVASFVEGSGWTSNDGLCAKHLNRLTAERHVDGATVAQAHAIITAEYPQAVRVEPV